MAVALGKLFSLESEDAQIERAIPLARKYAARYPERETGYAALAELLRLQAVDLAGSSRTPRAIETGRELMRLLEDRRRSFPSAAADVAIAGAAEALANPLSNQGAMQESLEMIDLAIAARAKDLARDPGSVTMKRAYLRDILFKADLLFDVDGFSLHRDEEAIALCREAKSITEDLLSKDPENALAVIDSASPLSRLSDLLRARDPNESYRLSVQARQFSERAFQKAPRAYGTQHNFGAALMRQAISAGHAGRWAEAWPLIAQAMELRKERARRLPKQPGVKYLMLRDYRKWIELLLLAGKREEARRVFAEGSAIAEEVDIAKTGYSYVQSAALLWETGARLGDGRECEYRAKAHHQWKALVDKEAFVTETKPRMARAKCTASE